MYSDNYIAEKKRGSGYRTTNVVNLINRAKLDQKKEKRKNIIISAAAISALVATGLIISL